jgi:hypothetical protein
MTEEKSKTSKSAEQSKKKELSGAAPFEPIGVLFSKYSYETMKESTIRMLNHKIPNIIRSYIWNSALNYYFEQNHHLIMYSMIHKEN